jgi:glycerol-3-phosphate O-acyltransferase
VKDTSLSAYFEHRASGALQEQQRKIVRFLARRCERDWTRAEIAAATGLRLSSVCARAHELIASQAIEELPRRPCRETGRGAHGLKLSAIQTSLPLEAA